MQRRKNAGKLMLIVLSCAVALGTTLALVLPGIALENQCQLQEHTHTEDCYAQPAEEAQRTLACAAQAQVHVHTEDCYDADGELVCGMADYLIHTHSDDCYDAEGVLVCPLDEHDGTPHTHDENCYQLQDVLTCGLEESDEHTHVDTCYSQIQILTCEELAVSEHVHDESCFVTEQAEAELICGLEEHIHTAKCNLPVELTEEEQAQVDEVIALIDALPTQEEIGENLTALEDAEDEDGYDAYLMEIVTQAKAAYEAYSLLTEAQQGQVTNAEKLLALEWLYSPATLEGDENKGEILPYLNDDLAYIYNFIMKADETTESKTHIRTGSAPWDDNDDAGNDSEDCNNILRSFDTVVYTAQFNTALRDVEALADVGGIKEGRLYFEFVLPLSAEEARFETGSMGWLQSAKDISYEQTTAEVMLDGEPVECQVLRGSYILTPTQSNAAAIGASMNELTIVIRALRMQNGDTIKPYFTLWLEHNDVGTAYENNIPTSIVTGTNAVCDEHEVCEAKTLEGTEVTISAAPMYNIGIQIRHPSCVALGTFDFDTGNGLALNQDAGEREGRLVGYGICIEIRGKENQGLRGVEFPNEDIDITFDLNLSSTYTYRDGDGTQQTVTDSDYYPLFWSGEGNQQNTNKINQDGREIAAVYAYTVYAPWNQLTNSNYNTSCEQGGMWSFAQDKDDPATIHVTVSGYHVGTHFPNSFAGGANATSSFYDSATTRYDPTAEESEYWNIDRAVFSAGEVWYVQPFADSSGTHVSDRYAAGTFSSVIEDSNMHITSKSGQEATNQQSNKDDRQQYLQSVSGSPGTIAASVSYNAYKGAWNAPLTEGCYQTDRDWAVTGTQVTLYTNLSHSGAEGDFVSVASDVMLKFDDQFFEPEGTARVAAGTYGKQTFLWGAKEDGSGWDHRGLSPDDEGYDDEMKQCTEDDLVWYTSLEALKEAGKVPVAVLYENRGVMENNRQCAFSLYVDGSVKAQCPQDQFYMVTRSDYLWRKLEVKESALQYYNAQHPDETIESADDLTDADWNEYLTYGFPSHSPDAAKPGKIYQDGEDTFSGDYPEMFWRQDYYYTNTLQIGEDGTAETMNYSILADCKKARYDADGKFVSGGDYRYQDSCYVMPFAVSITKQTAQKEQSGARKKAYDMNQNQRQVVYELDIEVTCGTGSVDQTTGNKTTVWVCVEDLMSAYLSYDEGSARLGGDFVQSVEAPYQGLDSVTGGQEFEPAAVGQLPNEEQKYLERIEYDPVDGKDYNYTHLYWYFPIEVEANPTEPTRATIYYSCTIGTAGNEDTDVVNGQEVQNIAAVYPIEHIDRYQNIKFGIQIVKSGAASLSKISDKLVAEKTDALGFTMNVGNNSSSERSSIVVETLPVNDCYHTHFTGQLQVEEFSAALVDANGGVSGSEFQFFYTTNEKYAGKLASDYELALEAYQQSHVGATMADMLQNNGWKQLGFKNTASEIAGLNLYRATGIENPEAGQIIAIVGVGKLPANQTLKMHVTCRLPDGAAGDYLVNYLSQDGNLSSYARTQIVSRSIEGLTWKDDNGDGMRSEASEALLDGVKVSLYWLQDGTYVPYCYPETNTPVVIETRQQVSVLDGAVTAYQTGRYKFTDLPAGTFAVRFESGTTDISNLLASPSDMGGDDTKDSDGVAVYSNDRSQLLYTHIDGIVMHAATELKYSTEESKNNDSGFYEKGHELPMTGGGGTGVFLTVGPAMVALALTGTIARRKRKQHS